MTWFCTLKLYYFLGDELEHARIFYSRHGQYGLHLDGLASQHGPFWSGCLVGQNPLCKYSKVPSQNGYTGEQAAQKLLDAAGITDVRIVRVDGSLTDHYNPRNKTLALSTPVFGETSIAAIGVATHEAGHAIQHATSYAALGWRSMRWFRRRTLVASLVATA